MVLSIISSIFSALLVGFAIASEAFLISMGSYNSFYWGNDYRPLGIALYAIQILIGLLEFAIAIAATGYSCRVLSFINDNPGTVHPGIVYPGAVYPGAIHPGAFDYQNPGAVMVSPGPVGYQYPGSAQVAAPQMAPPQMVAPQMVEPQMAAPQMAAPQMAAIQMAAPQMAAP